MPFSGEGTFERRDDNFVPLNMQPLKESKVGADGSDEEEKIQFDVHEEDNIDSQFTFGDDKSRISDARLSQMKSNQEISLSQIDSVFIKDFDWKYTK